MFLNTALILYYFKLDEDVKDPIDTLAFTHSANAHPEPFKLVFTPGSDGSEKDWEAVKESVDQALSSMQ